jgi:hypothetical protein
MPGIQEGSGGLAYARLEVVASAARIRRIRPLREVASEEDETGRRIMLSPDTPDGGAVKLYRETKIEIQWLQFLLSRQPDLWPARRVLRGIKSYLPAVEANPRAHDRGNS